jgi:hypothetical protein
VRAIAKLSCDPRAISFAKKARAEEVDENGVTQPAQLFREAAQSVRERVSSRNQNIQYHRGGGGNGRFSFNREAVSREP